MLEINALRVARFSLFFVLFSFVSLLLVGCGKKSKTEFSYSPPVIPLQFSVSRQNDGLWMVSGGVVTRIGTFAINQTFDTRDEYTYLVLRDRTKGTDQVFKLGVKGYVELHTKGEQKIRIQREENKVLLDVDTISGAFDFKVYPDSEAIARLELGKGQPDLVFFTDNRMAIENQSYIWADDSLPLDSIDNVTYQKSLNSRAIIFNWKPSLKDYSVPFVLSLSRVNADKNAEDLQVLLSTLAPNIKFNKTLSRLTLFAALISVGIALVLMPFFIFRSVKAFNGLIKEQGLLQAIFFSGYYKKGWIAVLWGLPFFLLFGIFCMCLGSLLGDYEIVSTIF